jgi:tryptophan synthase alpha chain
MVADASITGGASNISEEQIQYFQRIEKMKIDSPRLIGFGISDHAAFSSACNNANGAIIGSAFIRQLERDASDQGILDFVRAIRGEKVES